MDTGDLLLRLALVIVSVAGALSFPSLLGRRAHWLTGSVFGLHALLLVGALAVLWAHFLNHRFQYEVVAQFSSRALPPELALAASWAGQEGSILLWASLVALLGVAMLRQPGSLSTAALPFVSLVQVFLLGLLMVRSPFRLSAVVPIEGQGLNPLLEDPWMVAHPPVLFLGYAALVIPAALGVAALVRQDYREWNRVVWPWALFGVVTLGTGIVLGGVWAYQVLGWGGYWGWDPVENASLIPWLVSIALLHGLLIQRTTQAVVRTNLALAGIAWGTVIGGTYLTRSGVLQDFSVHSFADSGLNGPLLAFLLVSLAIPATLLAGRWKAIGAASDRKWATLSRESALWLGLVTVLILAGLVAFGTTAPVLTRLAGKPAGVQPEFYHLVSLPMGIAIVLLMALAPALRWSRQNGLSWLGALVPGFVLGALALGVAMSVGVRQPSHLALVVTTGIALGVNVVTTVRLFRRGWEYGAGYLGHVGVAVMVLGMVTSSALGRSERVRLVQGTPAQALGYRLTYRADELTPRGEHVLAVTLETPGRSLELKPRLLDMPRGEGKFRRPALSKWGELYLSPVEFEAQPAKTAEPVWLARGVETVIAGVGYTFMGFRVASHEAMQVFADIRVRRGERRTTASPGLVVDQAGKRSLRAEVPDLGPLAIDRIDADNKRVAVTLPGSLDPVSVAVVELSTKPFVNLVWIGALLALIGSGLAGVRRAAERAPRRSGRLAHSLYTARP